MLAITPKQLMDLIVDDLGYLGLVPCEQYANEAGALFEVGNQSITFARFRIDANCNTTILMTGLFGSKKTTIKYRGEQEATSAAVCSKLVALTIANRKV